MIEFGVCGDHGGDNRGDSGYGTIRDKEREKKKRKSSNKLAEN